MNYDFATPYLLFLLPVVLALALMPWYARSRTRPAAMRFTSADAARPESRSWKLRVRPFLSLLRWLALALLIVAAARPQSSEASEIVKGEGVDISLAVDISGSMAALDFDPSNRLDAAKDVITEFIEQREYDRIGIVVFASEAFVHSPPTVDHDTLDVLMHDVELASELGIMDGTAIGTGLATAASILKDSEAESRVVVLLTDGVNNSGEIDPMTAAVAAETLGIRVYTVGMGSPEFASIAPWSQPRNRRGVQRFDLDEDVLRDIAAMTGGKYYLATDTEGLRQIYEEINSLEKSEYEVSVYTKHEELAHWLLIPAALLLLLEVVARGTIFRPMP